MHGDAPATTVGASRVPGQFMAREVGVDSIRTCMVADTNVRPWAGFGRTRTRSPLGWTSGPPAR